MARLTLRLSPMVLAGGLASIFALALVLVLKFVVFAPMPPLVLDALEIKPLKPALVAAPGEFVTQSFSLAYLGPAEASYFLSLEVPENWQLLGLAEVNPIRLESGGSRRIFVTIGVPPLYPPGEYPIYLRLARSREPREGTLGFTVRVKAAAIPRVEPLSPRAEVDPERGWPVPIYFEVTNRGNRRGAFKLEVTAPSDWTESWEPKELTLSPGESEKVAIWISPPRGALVGVTEIALKAKVEGYGYEAEARAKVTLLPH